MLCQDLGPTHVGPIGLFPHQTLGLHIVPIVNSHNETIVHFMNKE